MNKDKCWRSLLDHADAMKVSSDELDGVLSKRKTADVAAIRRRLIMALVADGYTDRTIGAAIGLSHKSVAHVRLNSTARTETLRERMAEVERRLAALEVGRASE